MNAPHVQLRDWYTPTDLEPAKFQTPRPPDGVHPSASEGNLPPPSPQPPPQPQREHKNHEGLLEKLLPLIGKINNGGLDISTVLDLFDKSGQGLGAIGKLLPIIAPMLNGGLNGFKKKPAEDIVDYKTINLDN